MSHTKRKWDNIYKRRCQAEQAPTAARVLTEYAHLLPAHGIALDLACGLGGNTFFLSKQGLSVDAWDISEIATDHINQQTAAYPNKITTTTIDVSSADIPINHYDVITISRFLDRTITANIIAALKPNGLLFYQTFTLDKVSSDGPSNPSFLLKKNELLQLFSNLSLIVYQEEGALGDVQKGFRNEAMLIAQKE